MDSSTVHPFKNKVLKEILKFNQVGIRTLVYAERYLTHAQYLVLEEKYMKAMSNDNRDKQMFLLAEEYEKDLILLGAVAIEDKILPQVPSTIQQLLKANIKVWMVTGDKLETAESVGLRCGLIDPRDKTFYMM